jgi:hypothetical protein
MLILLNIFIIYVLLSIIGYLLMATLYYEGYVMALPNVKYRWLYYLIQFTWGLPMNFVGAIIALVLICFGKKAYRYGWNYCFELKTNFGLELGIFFIAPVGGTTHTKNHEHGHAIQNIYFGPFSVGMVSVPSALRFWARELQYAMNRMPDSGYDDIWFEGQATQTGNKFMNEKGLR